MRELPDLICNTFVEDHGKTRAEALKLSKSLVLELRRVCAQHNVTLEGL
jgi:hypothetical protein